MTLTARPRLAILFVAIGVLTMAWFGLLFGILPLSTGVEGSGQTVLPQTTGEAVPLAPSSVRVTTGASQELVVSWDAPDGDDGSLITGYKVRWKSGTEDYGGTPSSTRLAVLVGGDRLTYTIAGLTNGTDYTVQVIAYNGLEDGPASTEVTAAPEAPNIVVILVDDLGYADAGFSASTVNLTSLVETPNLDGLGEEGIVFTDGYVTFPVCTPSRAGLLAGRYPSRFGVEANIAYNPFDEHLGLPVEETTFPTYLRDAGYRTGVVGKWQLGGAHKFNPLERGFDYFYGFLGGRHDYWRVDASRPEEDPLIPLVENTSPVSFTGYLTDVLTDKAIEFVQKDQGEPFFLYLAYNAPHTPYQAPLELEAKYTDVVNTDKLTYLAMVDSLDQNVGRLLEALEQSGKRDNTIIFFLNDNGGANKGPATNGPYREGKGSFYEGGIRVPFVASWPARWPQGQTYEPMVISLDIAATALEAAKATVTDQSRPTEGVNLDPYLRGEEEGPPHEALFWRRSWPDQIAVVRSGDWKLLHVKGDTPQLFNVATSDGEIHDLFEANKNTAAELAALWNQWNSENFPGTLFTGNHGDGSYAEKLREFADEQARELRAAAESLPRHRIEVELPTNSAATGQPTIEGTAQVGETLTAETKNINDDDGLSNAVFSYQWLANDADISGATGASYTLAAVYEGKAIKVKVSFTDDKNNQETLTSVATTAVAERPIWSGTLTVGGSGTYYGYSGFSETGELSPKEFSLEGSDYTVWVLGEDGEGQAYLILNQEIPVDFVLQLGAVRLVSKYAETQDRGSAYHYQWDVGTVSLSVGDKVEVGLRTDNTPATGGPTISGTTQVGKTLTVETSAIDDADGMNDAVFIYQWLADDADIAGATDPTYTLADADGGKTIGVRVSFTDDRGHQETRTSDPTAAVAQAAVESSIWTSTLTVKRWGTSANRLFGFDGLLGKGKLEPEGVSHDGVEYRVEYLVLQKGGTNSQNARRLHFKTVTDLSAGAATSCTWTGRPSRSKHRAPRTPSFSRNPA